MSHEAIFLATCNATNAALQVARKKFTCNTPFCSCNCCVASCKKSRTTLYFSQRCETSCLRVTSPQQLATQFSQNGPIRAHISLAGDFCHLVCYCTRCKLRKKLQTCDTPLQLERFFLFVIVALQVARKIASCNMALLVREREVTLGRQPDMREIIF